MKYRVANIRTEVSAPEAELPVRVARAIGLQPQDIASWRILRKSLDARQRRQLQFIYTVEADIPSALPSSHVAGVTVGAYSRPEFDDPEPGQNPLSHRPVVVGSGPAGLLAAYYLAKRGYRPLVLERGCPVKERVPAVRSFDRGGAHDTENNYLFGEGGAGCFSDGKLTCRASGPDVDWVLDAFVACGGRPSLVYENRPHLGSNKLPLICRNFRRRIEEAGGEYRFQCRLEGLEISDGRLVALQTSSGRINADHCIVAVGHSARDTYEALLRDGLPLQARAFQLGLRIEHPQETVNEQKYGRPEYLDILGAADYSLIAKGQRDLFTFCMCAGGVIIPSISEPDRFCSNGMSNSKHDTPFANSGLVVTLDPELFGSTHPLAGVRLQQKYESVAFRLGQSEYLAPIQRAADFVAEKSPAPGEQYGCSYRRGTVAADLREVIPPVIADAVRRGLPVMDRKWHGKYLRDAVLVGPEMRGSSPVRIARDRESFEVPRTTGVYPAGEGAGYAGGIVTAAVDGLRCARSIVRRFAPCSDA